MPKRKQKTPTADNPYRILAAGNDRAEVMIYGDIGGGIWDDESVTAKSLTDELNALAVSAIDVRINSFGGSLVDGIAIFNALRRHDADIVTHIDGVAYSAASLIAMAGDEISMADNSLMMIHAPWSASDGNASELRKQADTLDKYADAMAKSYQRDGGPDADQIKVWLTDGEDHYFTADEAITLGLVDNITESLDIAAALRGFDFGRLKNPAVKPAPTGVYSMTEKKKAGATAAPQSTAAPDDINVIDIQDAERKKVQAAMKARNEEIQTRAAAHLHIPGIRALVDEFLIDPAGTVDEFSAKAMAELGKHSQPTSKPGSGAATAGVDGIEKFKLGAVAALSARAGIIAHDSANEFRGYSLSEIARAALSQRNVNTTRMTRMDLVSAAFTHSTSDFGNLLADVANKSMLKGYDEAEETFQTWTASGNLPDFKPGNRVDLNSFPSLREVREGAEYKYATVGDRGEQIQLATYGEMFSITRQAIINDDLSAFTRIPALMGRAAIRTVGDLVYAILTGNPVMSDGVALFHATHNNLLPGIAINTDSVDAMRVAMATQSDADSNANALNIRLATLLVPMALEGTAKIVRDSEFEVKTGNRNNTTPNSVRGTFEVISDARLDKNSAVEWYGTASGSMHDTIEVAYLDGNQAPALEQQQGWNVDGAEFKVRIDAGVKALDFRTMAKNPGA